MQQRVVRLDASSREMLHLAAMLGPESWLDVLFQLRAEFTGGSLQALIDAGLLVIDSGAEPERVRFRDALLQQAIYSDLTWSRRRQLHREIADGLTHQPGSQPFERIARHWELAGEAVTAHELLVSQSTVARTSGNVGRAASLGVAALQLAERHAELSNNRSHLTLGTTRRIQRGAGKVSCSTWRARQIIRASSR